MSNPEKTRMETEEETNDQFSDESHDHSWSDEEAEEGEIREIVLALPALSVSERVNVDDQALREKASVAAQLVVAAAEDAMVTTKENTEQTVAEMEGTHDTETKRAQKVKFDDAVGGASDSVEVLKKPRKKGSSQLHHPPKGTPKCNVCAKEFVSWKAVFGHLRAHKDRGYHGFFPPPMFNAGDEGFGGVQVGASSGGRGLGFDLNVEPMENDDEEAGTGSALRFDLNRSPPQDEDEEEDEDKAE